MYRERPLGGRDHIGRRVNLTEYLSSPPEELVVDDDEREGYDGFDGLVTESMSSFMEGTRVNSEVYDAYGAHGWSSRPLGSSLSSRSHPNIPAVFAPPPDSTENSSGRGSPAQQAEFRANAWGPPGGTTVVSGSVPRLARQHSSRRPIRSRAVDFNDFSTRRRSNFRDVAADSEDLRASDEIPLDFTNWISATTDEQLGSPETSSGARRFFPFSRRRHDAAWHEVVTVEPPFPPEEIHTILRPWHAPSTSSSSSLLDRDHPPTPTQETVPRLRRGGLRAPESMLSRHASPAAGEIVVPSTSIVISMPREAIRDAVPENAVQLPPATSERHD